MNYIHKYQNTMDHRLSKPKQLKRVTLMNSAERFFKNTSHDEQMMHQSVFSKKFKDLGGINADDKF